ncbi:MAG TPA: flagellar hook-basal body protein [Solirubrobacteraceae bacterium]|nr:flagellar hook-basal body protein [Solirubrobacteraceae bacterium]
MDTGLYIAASGMLAQQVREDQLANDLSNASTPGYKTDASVQSDFGSMLLANTATGQQIGQVNTGVQLGKPVTDLSPASLHSTGQPLDFGIAGDGFFAVRTPQGVQYTRDGQFQESAQGLLVDGQGNDVLSQNGAPIQVSAQGTVPASSVGVFNVTNPTKQGYNYFTGSPAGRGSGIVKQGELEESQVDPINTMVHMISATQTYQAGENAIQTIDSTMQESSQSVGSLGG